MAEKELRAARLQAEAYKADLTRTTGLLKERLKPANLASDAWHVVRDKGVEYGGKGVNAASGHRGPVAGIGAALLLLVLRKPIAHFLSWTFGSNREPVGAVKADLLHASKEYDLTAPVVTKDAVAKNQGA